MTTNGKSKVVWCCNVCCENINKSNHAPITCPVSKCSFEACKTCVRTYILNTTDDPHCMNCKNPFESEFLVTNLNRTFMENEYKNHRKNLLVEKEISRTPELMPMVEREGIIQKHKANAHLIWERYQEAQKVFKTLKDEYSEALRQIENLKNGDISKERKQFIMPCPGDDCKGYLSTQYKCEVCQLFTCPDCFEIIGYKKDDPHTCKPENIQSTKVIKKDTKGCPQCGVRIYKISGCDQMWCTECKVAFSWNTGKIVVTGLIHNPHYYQFLNNNGTVHRNPGDVLCGGLIPYFDFNNILRKFIPFKTDNWFTILKSNKKICDFVSKFNIINLNELLTIFGNLHRIVNHITNIDLNNCRNKVRDYRNNDNITIDYILNKISKDSLASIVLRNDVQRKKHTDILNIYEIISVVGIERFRTISETINDNDYHLKKGNNFIDSVLQIINLFTEFNNLVDYSNKQLVFISYTYNQNVTYIKYIEENADKKIMLKYSQTNGKFNKSQLELIRKNENNLNSSFNYKSKVSGYTLFFKFVRNDIIQQLKQNNPHISDDNNKLKTIHIITETANQWYNLNEEDTDYWKNLATEKNKEINLHNIQLLTHNNNNNNEAGPSNV